MVWPKAMAYDLYMFYTVVTTQLESLHRRETIAAGACPLSVFPFSKNSKTSTSLAMEDALMLPEMDERLVETI